MANKNGLIKLIKILLLLADAHCLHLCAFIIWPIGNLFYSFFQTFAVALEKDVDECIIMPGHVLGRRMRKAKTPMTILLIKLLDRANVCVCVIFCFKYSGPNRCKCCPLSRFHGSPTFGLDSSAARQLGS